MNHILTRFGILGLLTASALFLSSTTANAQYGTYGGYGIYGQTQPYSGFQGNFGGYTGPVYHQPSVHYDRVYHPTTTHWTPGRGLHTHGHTHLVPHYTPGHFDLQHGNHIHPNPYYHNH